MRPLSLDYRRGSLIQHRIGMVMLTVALMAIVAMGGYYRNLTGQSARVELQVAKVEQKLHPGRSQTLPVNAQQAGAEIKAANEVVMQLTLPWNELFNALEETNTSDIALLGIEPDSRKRVVRLSGEAKNAAALFEYVRLLQANKAMSSVYLRRQQVQEQNPEKPVRFTLDASWI